MNKTLMFVLIGFGVWWFFLREKPRTSGGGPVPEGTYV